MAKPLVIDEVWQERILNQVSGIQYGQVIITVHDGRIVQIDRTERVRYEQSPAQKQAAEPLKAGGAGNPVVDSTKDLKAAQ
ncbi:DUF2292 domain-containing protein [Paenibacillus nanensis]|uniref:DUF2292 domain-containing protein n=1 Tax=Paenibacillus nanensis TaxID=393251 RepID=A0A3A1V674_9BACL|nr:YezD family protein [Paenibacillus nanensis]RIX53010.1 DUF2292 domain-containing protein [Paenibacillus nanensis]